MHIKDIVVITHEIGNLHAPYYLSVPGDRVPTTYFCMLQSLVQDACTRCLWHVTTRLVHDFIHEMHGYSYGIGAYKWSGCQNMELPDDTRNLLLG